VVVSVLQCVAVCCSAVQCGAVRCSVLHPSSNLKFRGFRICCRIAVVSVLQCVAVCCSAVQCVAVCCSALPCAALLFELDVFVDFVYCCRAVISVMLCVPV